jgi:hypothetical protein
MGWTPICTGHLPTLIHVRPHSAKNCSARLPVMSPQKKRLPVMPFVRCQTAKSGTLFFPFCLCRDPVSPVSLPRISPNPMQIIPHRRRPVTIYRRRQALPHRRRPGYSSPAAPSPQHSGDAHGPSCAPPPGSLLTDESFQAWTRSRATSSDWSTRLREWRGGHLKGASARTTTSPTPSTHWSALHPF